MVLQGIVLYCWLRRAGCISQDTYLLYIYTLEVDFYDKIPSETETSVSAEVEVVIRMGVWPPKNRYKV